MAIEVKIKKQLNTFQLNIDFKSNSKRIGILGASGCGKSMTLKSIAGIVTPDEGSISIEGRKLFDRSEKVNLKPQQRKVGYLFQNYALFPTMNVEKNIAAGLKGKNKQEIAARVKEMVEKFQLQGLEKRLPAQLSGGQQQRVALARIMAYEPDVILLDEPFSALDMYLKDRLQQELIQMLEDYQGTVIMVSHNRDEVYRLCNGVSCVNRGKLEVIEPVKEFFRNPKTKTAAALSGCKNIADVELAHEEGQTVLQAAQWNCNFTFTSFPTQMSENRMSWDEVGAIGIRAHYLEPVYQGQQVQMAENDNILELAEYQVIEDSFEWIVLFRVSDKGDWIQWKTPKIQEQELELPDRFRIRQENLLFLRKE